MGIDPQFHEMGSRVFSCLICLLPLVTWGFKMLQHLLGGFPLVFVKRKHPSMVMKEEDRRPVKYGKPS